MFLCICICKLCVCICVCVCVFFFWTKLVVKEETACHGVHLTTLNPRPKVKTKMKHNPTGQSSAYLATLDEYKWPIFYEKSSLSSQVYNPEEFSQ